MKATVKNGDDLRQWFLALGPHPRAEQMWQEGVCVTTKIRRETLTHDRQGKIVLKGTVRTIKFDNLGGGVYRATLEAAKVKGKQ